MTTRYVTCGFFTLLVLPVLVVHAQELSHSFEDLSRSVSAGTTIRLVDRNGTIMTGPVESVSADFLRMRVGGDLREVTEDSVQQIWRQRPDSVANGVLIGLGAGLATGVMLARANCSLPDDECLAITTVAFVPAAAVGGSVFGWLIDRAMHGYDPIFEAPARSGNGSVSLLPFIDRQKRGVQLRFSF